MLGGLGPLFVSVWHLNPKFKVANEALEELGEAERVGLLGEEADDLLSADLPPELAAETQPTDATASPPDSPVSRWDLVTDLAGCENQKG